MKLLVNIEYKLTCILKSILLVTVVGIACLLPSRAEAQEMDMQQDLFMFHVNGGIGLPGGDLADRFGFYGKAGAAFSYRFGNNWYAKISTDFIFGSEVKQDSLLDKIMTDRGRVIGSDGILYRPEPQMRGWQIMAWGGKLFPLQKEKINSGILTMIGAGLVTHRINYFLSESGTVPQITGKYEKGYDRMTNGFSVAEYIGYHHMSENRLVNFNVGIEMVQAFTSNRREFDYFTGSSVADNRIDLMFNLKVSWILPFYKRSKVDIPEDNGQPNF